MTVILKVTWCFFNQKDHIFWEGRRILPISTVDLSYVITVKSTVEILQNVVAFSEYMNFIYLL